MSEPAVGTTGEKFPTALIAGAGIGICGGMAVLFMTTISIFMIPIINDLGWTRSQVSLMMTAAFLGYALGSPVLGVLFDRLGARLVLSIGIANLVVALILMGNLELSPALAAGLALEIGFVGAATAPSGYVLIMALSTNRRLGLVLGLSMLGYGVGVTLMPVVVERLIAALGWRDAYIAMAGIALLFGAAALLLGVGRNVVGTVARAAANGDYSGISFREAVRDYRFWIIGMTALMLAVAGFGVTAHLAAIASDRGFTTAAAAGVVSIFGAGMFAGRVGAAVLMDKIFAPYVAAAMSALGGLGLLLLLLISGEDIVAMYVAAFMVGLLTGSEGDTMPFLTRRFFGKQSFGAIFGCIVGIAGLGGIIGPFAFGWTFDNAASYAPILMLSLALCILSSVLFLLMGAYRYPADS